MPILLLLSLLVVCAPSGAWATLYWNETFEGLNFNNNNTMGQWIVQGGVPELEQPQPGKIDIVSTGCFAGSSCLRLTYDDLNIGSGPFARREYPATTHVFNRTWMRVPVNFQASNNSTKIVYGPRTNTEPNCVSLFITSRRPFFDCQTFSSPATFWAVGTVSPTTPEAVTPSLADNQWHCIETEVLLGTPNVSNGEMRLWIDDVPWGTLTNIELISASASFFTLYFYRERGLGELFFDDVAVANERIGCAGTPPNPGDTTPPTSVTGIMATAGNGQVQISGLTASDNIGIGVFNVYRSTSPTGPFTLIGQAGAGGLQSPPPISFLDTGLTNGTTYYYNSAAQDTSGNIGPSSSTVSATPQAPTGGGATTH